MGRLRMIPMSILHQYWAKGWSLLTVQISFPQSNFHNLKKLITGYYRLVLWSKRYSQLHLPQKQFCLWIHHDTKSLKNIFSSSIFKFSLSKLQAMETFLSRMDSCKGGGSRNLLLPEEMELLKGQNYSMA